MPVQVVQADGRIAAQAPGETVARVLAAGCLGWRTLLASLRAS
jgi:hypothetical protein